MKYQQKVAGLDHHHTDALVIKNGKVTEYVRCTKCSAVRRREDGIDDRWEDSWRVKGW